MRNKLLTLFFFLLSCSAYNQTEVESLVSSGIKYHDKGQYDQAINSYKKALQIDPNSSLVNYEISYTYLMAGDYENSLIHSSKVIKLNDKYVLESYVSKSSCLDYLGQTEEAIKLLEKGIKKFGDNYLLYYNLAFDYYKIENYEKARTAAINALNENMTHASSHLLLGYIMNDLNLKPQSLLSLYYFLFLEPNSERAKTAYNLLQQIIKGNVQKDPDSPNQINIFLNGDQENPEYGAVELMIGALQATRYTEENEGKSDEDFFIESTKSIFSIFGELKNKKCKGLWWDFYVPFFYKLAKSENIDTFCYYISQGSNKTALSWLKNNSDKIEQFESWLAEN